jgi:hypothetical protein
MIEPLASCLLSSVKVPIVLTTCPREGERRRRRRRTSPANRHQGLHLDSQNLHHLLLLDQGLLLLGQLLLLLAHQSLHVVNSPPFFSHLILRCVICFFHDCCSRKYETKCILLRIKNIPGSPLYLWSQAWAFLYSGLGAHPAPSELGESMNGLRGNVAISNP